MARERLKNSKCFPSLEGTEFHRMSFEKSRSSKKSNGEKNRSPWLFSKSADRWRGEMTSFNGENLQKMTKNFQDFQLPISLLITV